MYIAHVRIEGYRCFKDTCIDFQPGLNVLIGENNAGKTTVLRALGLVFDKKNRRRIDLHDFCKASLQDHDKPPSITVTVTLKSSEADTLDDKALVATWLTKLTSPWEAQLTYKFFLPEEQALKFTNSLGDSPDDDKVHRELEAFLPKYVAKVYGGCPENNLVAEPDSLGRFDCVLLDAIRDVESELFSGSNPLLRNMLLKVLDRGLKEAEKSSHRENFHGLADSMRKHIISRLRVDELFKLVESTGAHVGGTPHLKGRINEADILAALKLFIEGTDCNHPATHNGLGYNNLIYISLILSSLDTEWAIEKEGQNAILFPILLIEEPEAHLHPALQYRLLKYIKARLSEKVASRQIFLTTHSTQITAASGLAPIICMSAQEKGEAIRIAYPSKAFNDDVAGKRSRKYIERYLDATKSNILFTKGVIFVEGLAELLLFPCLAEYVESPIEENHVAVVAVGGSTFLHFLPLFGAANSDDRKAFSLVRKVALVVDADPARKSLTAPQAKAKKCWPYQLGDKPNEYAYTAESGVVTNLRNLTNNHKSVKLYVGLKTFEYDLAHANSSGSLLVTSECTHELELTSLAENPLTVGVELSNKLNDGTDSLESTLSKIIDPEKQRAARFATCYLMSSEGGKGAHAFELEQKLRTNLSGPAETRVSFSVPKHIREAILWVSRTTPAGPQA